MAAVAPDIALLRNEIVKTLRGMGHTYDSIGAELGISRQSVLKLIAAYDLDGRGSARVLSDSDKAIVKLAKKWEVPPPVPVAHIGLKRRK